MVDPVGMDVFKPHPGQGLSTSSNSDSKLSIEKFLPQSKETKMIYIFNDNIYKLPILF